MSLPDSQIPRCAKCHHKMIDHDMNPIDGDGSCGICSALKRGPCAEP